MHIINFISIGGLTGGSGWVVVGWWLFVGCWFGGD